MIHVVVAVLAVAADAEQIIDLVEALAEQRKLLIGAEVGRIGLLHAHDMALLHRARRDDMDLLELLHREIKERLVRHRPEVVALRAEILEAEPYRMLRVLHEIRRPVDEDLQAADAHIRLLNIDPAVRHDIAERPFRRLILQKQLVDEHARRHEITIGELCGHIMRGMREPRPGKRSDKILDRHARKYIIRRNRAVRAVLRMIPDLREMALSLHAVVLVLRPQARDMRAHMDLAAHLTDLLRHRLPELARAVLRVKEPVDERGLDVLWLQMKGLREEILQHGGQRDALDALASPIRPKRRGILSPDLLRIFLEKGLVKLFAESIHHEILQRLLLPLMKAGMKIRAADAEHTRQAEIPNGLRVELHRIIEKFVQIEDARDAMAQEEHIVLLLRICAIRRQRALPAEHLVIIRGRAHRLQQLMPELLDLLALRKKAMPADIHAVAAEIHGARDAAEHRILLEHDGVDVRLPQKLVGGRQACRAAADDHGRLLL
jgi:hypothetical protein